MEFAEFYLDESETGNGRWFCVAGWVFLEGGRKALQEEWFAILREEKLPFLHMVDFAPGQPPYAHLDQSERIRIQRRFFEVLKRYALAGIATTFELALAPLLPYAIDRDGGRFHVTPYTFCCYWAFHQARRWVKDSGYDGRIAYFFENGPYKSQADRMMSDVFSNPKLAEIFRYGGHGFMLKKESAAVQTADVLAWLWAKGVKDRAMGKTKPRADMLALALEIPIGTTHFDEPALRGFLEIITKDAKVVPTPSYSSGAGAGGAMPS